ncbi:hypothetical protein A8F94_07675 [Bacillus sp. FJAT-27225]|uniref:ATP-grasp domain-containing protein n=1 Tax=Bacillus sp. FJAT-27225 TaxID=1743144 RepID=UPI00080C293E|nr:ATP-grasp domain-containing protein [Bacillus sp. FJAT-27225]OCA87723.1 hypothetical protein A8F94_07675 [Bacillus sp. FJAT-27225]
MNVNPNVTLADIYGPEFILNPRTSYSGFGWVPTDNHDFDDFRTGAPLSIVGEMPMVANERVVTEESLKLMRLAGITEPSNLYVYNDENSIKSLINNCVEEGKKQVINQIYPPEEIPEKGYWIKPDLLSYLNNKASLSELVPEGHYPRRIAVKPTERERVKMEWKLPFVLKTATDLPNGGGIDVALCQTEEDVNQAWEAFKESEQIVVEELVNIEKNYCVQFARTHEGEIICLGAAEQITTDDGNHSGNWLSDCEAAPDDVMAVGEKIMENAAKLDYVGVGGFDILTTTDGRIVCIDLNFRLNASTPALLLKDSILSSTKKEYLLYRTWQIETDWEDFYGTCQSMIENRELFPLSIYKPEDNQNARPRISAILAGDTKEEIIAIEEYLDRHGWK